MKQIFQGKDSLKGIAHAATLSDWALDDNTANHRFTDYIKQSGCMT